MVMEVKQLSLRDHEFLTKVNSQYAQYAHKSFEARVRLPSLMQKHTEALHELRLGFAQVFFFLAVREENRTLHQRIPTSSRTRTDSSERALRFGHQFPLQAC